MNSLLLEEKGVDKGLLSELAAALQKFLEASQISIERTAPKELKGMLLRELG